MAGNTKVDRGNDKERVSHTMQGEGDMSENHFEELRRDEAGRQKEGRLSYLHRNQRESGEEESRYDRRKEEGEQKRVKGKEGKARRGT